MDASEADMQQLLMHVCCIIFAYVQDRLGDGQ